MACPAYLSGSSDLTVSTNKKKTRNRWTVLLSETSKIVVMFVATQSPPRTSLHNLQCVLSCHYNIVVCLLADIPGVRSAGCLPRQTRGWAGCCTASQAVKNISDCRPAGSGEAREV